MTIPHGAATRLLHKYTSLISGVAPSDYSAVPLTEPNELGGAAEEGKEASLRRAKEASVAMSWTDWRIQMWVASSLPSGAVLS